MGRGIGFVRLGGVVVALLSMGAPAMAARLPAEVVARVQEEGSARVIVRLDAPASAQQLSAGGEGADALRAGIAAARAAVEDGLAGTAWQRTRSFATIPFAAFEVSAEALAALAASPGVLAVSEDRLESIALRDSVPIVQADQAQAAGFDGTGWAIAVLDTGVDGSHPFLAGKVVSEACFSAIGSCPNGQQTQIGAGSAGPCGYAANACPHGTHVAGVAAGRGDGISGVAPGATILSMQVFSRFTGSTCDDDIEDPCARTYTSDTIAALERVFELRETFRIAAANLSFGGGRYFSQAECDAEDAARRAIVENLRAAGIVTISASGNSDWLDSTTAPACLTAAVAVGAVDKGDRVAGFSNSASFLDFLAPGVRIESSVPPGSFQLISGTSQAAPHVAGAYAILAQRLGSASPDAIAAYLRDTGLPITDERNGVVAPRIQIRAALDAIPGAPRGSGLQLSPDGKRVLISKDVGSERWAITENVADGSVTGNVFRADGGAPSFVSCVRLRDDGNPNPLEVQITFGCSGADACADAACPPSTWTSLGEVTLPGAFFEPSTAGTAMAAAGAAPASEAAPSGAAPAGVQRTPDAARRSLVSKDVGLERWAITRHPEDGTVTGNVFRSDGGEPAFLWCEEIGRNGSDVSYECSGADRCDTPTCAPSDWSVIAEVTLPDAFFLP